MPLYPPQLRFFSSPGGVRLKGQQQELQSKHQCLGNRSTGHPGHPHYPGISWLSWYVIHGTVKDCHRNQILLSFFEICLLSESFRCVTCISFCSTTMIILICLVHIVGTANIPSNWSQMHSKCHVHAMQCTMLTKRWIHMDKYHYPDLFWSKPYQSLLSLQVMSRTVLSRHESFQLYDLLAQELERFDLAVHLNGWHDDMGWSHVGHVGWQATDIDNM